MRILLINFMETTYPGGINKTVTELAKHLSKKGHEVLILQSNPLNLPEEENYEGSKILRIKSIFRNSIYGFNPEMYFYLKKHFTDFNLDIIHMHGYQTLLCPEILFFVNRTKLGIPVVLTPHYDPLNRNTLAGKLFGKTYDQLFGERILRLTDHIISVSDFEANNIKRIHDCEITVIPNGIESIDIQKKVKDNLIKLLYVGYLLYYKGVQFIIKTIHHLVYTKNIRNISFTIIGEGDYKPNLLKLAKELDVLDFIVWKPFYPHSKVLEEMRKSDIFLLLSLSEGYGIVVAEALSVGTPSIVTMNTALEEFTLEKGCFGVENPDDPEEIADIIIEIYSNDLTVGPFTKKIKTWGEVADDYENSYRELIESRR